MNSLRKFVFSIGICFAVPTYLMVVRPYAAERSREAVPYVMAEVGAPEGSADPDDLKGLYYPPVYAGDRKRGAQIYGREGCAQCHTQVIRAAYAGIDQFKKDWGKTPPPDQKGVQETRQTVMWDYMHENFAMLGQRRLGPDLANAGYRFEGKVNELYAHLYAPRAVHAWSNSPSFKHLFETRKIEGNAPSQDALQLSANLAPEEGWEIVPTSDGKALADYILGLKRDQPIPVSITGPKAKK